MRWRGLDVPVVVGCDVNETAAGGSWKLLSEGPGRRGGANDGEPTGTFPVTGPRRRIDAIMVDPAVAGSSGTASRIGPGRAASDHFPIVSDVALPVHNVSLIASRVSRYAESRIGR